MNNEQILHIDLFSGIGGFALATEAVWKNVKHIFVENDPFCTQVLAKHWPEATYFGDIRTFTPDTLRERYDTKENEQVVESKRSDEFRLEQPRPFILTGGFPCQPFSQAGRRRGAADDRFLWPEMFRVIREFRPLWVIAENVRGLLTQGGGVVFEQVCADLESEGYAVQPLIIPAVAVNAPHRRDRVWFVAHKQYGGNRRGKQPEEGGDETRRDIKNAQNPIGERSGGRNENGRQVLERESPETENARPSWETNWLEVATQFCSVDDGLPVALDGFELSKSKNRAEQLKAYGNAIVPAVAVEIMKAIKESPKSPYPLTLK